MEQHIICTQCRGSKRFASLGFIETECNMCKGYGFINRDLTPAIFPTTQSFKITPKQKKVKPHALDGLRNKLDLVDNTQ